MDKPRTLEEPSQPDEIVSSEVVSNHVAEKPAVEKITDGILAEPGQKPPKDEMASDGPSEIVSAEVQPPTPKAPLETVTPNTSNLPNDPYMLAEEKAVQHETFKQMEHAIRDRKTGEAYELDQAVIAMRQEAEK
ncbi:MAG: hypothetical protein WC773_00805 [Patescibacteria group bacterium]|jgi:hypothetical protein